MNIDYEPKEIQAESINLNISNVTITKVDKMQSRRKNLYDATQPIYTSNYIVQLSNDSDIKTILQIRTNIYYLTL